MRESSPVLPRLRPLRFGAPASQTERLLPLVFGYCHPPLAPRRAATLPSSRLFLAAADLAHSGAPPNLSCDLFGGVTLPSAIA